MFYISQHKSSYVSCGFPFLLQSKSDFEPDGVIWDDLKFKLTKVKGKLFVKYRYQEIWITK